MADAESNLQHALTYALRGWHVFPLAVDSNKPAKFAEHLHGHKDATTSAEEITRCWQHNPRYNIGVHLKPSRLVVVDIDRHTGDGFETLQQLEAKYGPLPATLTATTPRGGEHRYFSVPDGAKLPGNLGPEIDIKHDGYTVLPPSRRNELARADYEGRTARITGDYAWLDEHAAIAALPEWILMWKAAAPQPYVVKSEGGLRIDGRRRAAMSLAGAMRARGCDADTILTALRADNEAQNAEPLPDADLQAIANGFVERYAPNVANGRAVPDLICRTDGTPLNVLANVVSMISGAPEMQGVLAKNLFSLNVETRKVTPWGFQGEWNDTQDSALAVWLQYKRINVRTAVVAEAVNLVAAQQAYHPVKDYLNGLGWDGVPRLDTWLVDLLRADTGDAGTLSNYVSAVGARFLISAVARIFQPGCQADQVLVFEGRQGVRKSTAARVLFEPFFTDDIADLGDKDSKITVASGNWCIELAEMDAASRKDVNTVKAFITRREDKFRAPYDRRLSVHPRQCVLLATTNDSDYLRDSTGGRRFWPVRIPQVVDAGRLRQAKDQLWAEAVHRYRHGSIWWIEPHEAELLGVVQSEQEERTAKHPWQSAVEDFLQDIDVVTMPELLEHCLNIPKSQWEQRHQTVLGRLLRAIGWEQRKIQTDGVRFRCWSRPEGGSRRFKAAPGF